jgi:hypothetical protein
MHFSFVDPVNQFCLSASGRFFGQLSFSKCESFSSVTFKFGSSPTLSEPNPRSYCSSLQTNSDSKVDYGTQKILGFWKFITSGDI